jgi:hypothetical protein
VIPVGHQHEGYARGFGRCGIDLAISDQHGRRRGDLQRGQYLEQNTRVGLAKGEAVATDYSSEIAFGP